jgi:hypothetical protein
MQVHFYFLQNQDLSTERWCLHCSFCPRFLCLYYLNFHLRQHLTQFFSFLCYPLPHRRNIIPPHICYSIIVQMIDFLVNCISAPYIIKICDFVALWSEDNIRRNLVLLYKIYTVSKKMCVEGFHTDRAFLLRTPFCIEIPPHKQG